MVTLASPHYEPATIPVNHPDMLKDLNCITGSINKWSFQSSDDGPATAAAEPPEHKDVYVRGNLICKNGHALVNAGTNGMGIIRVPAFYCKKEITSGELVPVLTGWIIPPTPVFALYHAKKYLPKRLTAFLAFLSKRFPQAMAGD